MFATAGINGKTRIQNLIHCQITQGLKKIIFEWDSHLQTNSWIPKNIKAVRQQGIFNTQCVLSWTALQFTTPIIIDGWHVAYLRFNACLECLTTCTKHHFHTSKGQIGKSMIYYSGISTQSSSCYLLKNPLSS